MKSLSNSDKQRREEIIAELNEASSEIQAKRDGLDSEISDLNAAIASYNEKLQAARDFAEHVSNGIGDYMDEKSEKWLDSERGEAYQSWKDEWDAFGPEDIEDIELPDFDADDAADELGNLPEEPSE